MVDVVVIGGSYAGLSAALQLARARRRVAVVDAGRRRNRFAGASHGFLGQDGVAPADIAARGRAELTAYPTVTWIEGAAVRASGALDAFAVELASGERLEARRVILALGVEDELPAVPGLAERWGRAVFHCPYCHGYELGGGPVAVLGTGPLSVHQALMLPDWGPTTYFTRGLHVPSEEEAAELRARGVTVVPGEVARIEGEEHAVAIHLASGEVRGPFAGAFTASRTRIPSDLPEQLGCALDEGPMGLYVRTDAWKATTVAGVFACGDAALAAGSVAFAVGDGARAGIASHRTLLFGA